MPTLSATFRVLATCPPTRGLPGVARLRRTLGIDTRQAKYTFQHDPVAGHVASARVADEFEAVDLGAPFKVILHKAVRVTKTDHTTNY